MGMAFDSDAKVGAGIDFSDPNSPLARYYFRFGDVFAVSLIAAVYVLLNFGKLWHTDIWGHVKHGELWLQTRQFPVRDVLSYASDPNGGTINYAWMSQVLLAGTFRCGAWLAGDQPSEQIAGGADALRFLNAILVTLRLSLLYMAFRRLANSSVIACIGIGFIVVVSLGNLAILRPQVVAEVLFAGLIFLLSPRESSWFSVIAIGLLLTLWANVHASFPIGCITVGALWVGRLFEILTSAEPATEGIARDVRLQHFTGMLVLAVLGITVLNPEGWRIWHKTAAMANHPNVRAMDEWQSLLHPTAVGARLTYLFCIAWIGMAFAVGRSRATPEVMALALAFAIPPLFHQRAVVWLITVAAWVSITPLAAALARGRPTWWTSVPNFRRTILAGAIGIIAILWSIPARHLIDQKPMDIAKSVSDGTPWELALRVANGPMPPNEAWSKIMQAYPENRFQGGVFTSETLGDFFLWPLRPPALVFIYSHVHLFSPEHWQRYIEIRDAQPNWKKELDRDGINLVVLYAEPMLNLAKELARDKDWQVLLDETGRKEKIDPRCRLFAAIRKQPLLPKPQDTKTTESQ